MGKKVFENIVKLLNEKQVVFEHLTHEHVHKSKDAAKIRGNSIEQAAKAIILKIKPKKSDTKYVIIQCVLSGNKKINFRILRNLLNLKSASLATPEEVLEKTDCTIGSVPPFGVLFDIPVYADNSVFLEEEIVFSAGTHNDSIKMKSSDWRKVVKPIILDFSELDLN